MIIIGATKHVNTLSIIFFKSTVISKKKKKKNVLGTKEMSQGLRPKNTT